MSNDARTFIATATTNAASVAGPAPGDWAPLEQWQLTAHVRLEDSGPIVEREPVVRRDFEDVLAELWFEAWWRRGEPGRRFESMSVELAPRSVSSADGGRLVTGYELRTPDPAGDSCRRVFTILSLQWAAERAARRLIAQGRLRVGDTYVYDLVARRRDPDRAEPEAEQAAVPMTAVRRDPPLRWLFVDPRTLLDGARTVGRHGERHEDRQGGEGDWPHVFYTDLARVQAERLSRLGAQRAPAVESGAALLGTLCMCPDRGDMFVVVTHALEVSDAQSSEFSLEYSSRSWQRLMAVTEAMRRQPETSTLRLLGQAHGHNFMPADGAPPCEHCASAAQCGRTSVFISQDDLNWSRAVFSRQPFALSHIYGLSARHLRPNPDEVECLFGLRDGRLLPRPYHVIDRFDPAQWPQGSTDDENGCGRSTAHPLEN